MELEFVINYEVPDNYEYIVAVYDTEEKSINYKRTLSLTDNVDDLNISDGFKKALNEVPNITIWCLDSLEIESQINNLIIEFDYQQFLDDIYNMGYHKMWRKLVDTYGEHDLFENGYYTPDTIEELYKELRDK